MPYTGIVLAILAFHAAAFLILLGHWVAAAGMFPQATKAFADQYELRPLRAVLLGVVTYGPLFLLLLQTGGLQMCLLGDMDVIHTTANSGRPKQIYYTLVHFGFAIAFSQLQLC